MIDWKRVEELRAEVGEDGFREVADLFLTEITEVIDRLTAGADPARLEEDLHFIKGSAWTLGFRQLGALCEIGEKQAAEGMGGQVDLRAIVTSFRNSRAAFAAPPGAERALA